MLSAIYSFIPASDCIGMYPSALLCSWPIMLLRRFYILVIQLCIEKCKNKMKMISFPSVKKREGPPSGTKAAKSILSTRTCG